MSNKEPLNVVENNNLHEDELWYKTIQEDTIESYENYVMIFPEGPKVEKALSLIRHYELLRERSIWEEARSKNTVYHFQHYLKESRLKTHEGEANRRLSEIEKYLAKQEEDTLQKKSGPEIATSDLLTTQKTSYTSVPKKFSASFLSPKKSTKPSGKIPRKRKFYPALFSLVSVLVITAGLAMWNRSRSVTSHDYAGVDSIIITTMKSGDLVTEAVSDSIDISSPVIDQNTNGKQPADNNFGSSGNREDNDTSGKVNVEENLVTSKPAEIEKKPESVRDSNLNAKLPLTIIEPVVVKDSISPKEEFKGPLKMPHGLQISVILDEPLSSEEVSKNGTPIKLHCSGDIEFDGKTVIAKGAPVTGKIINVVPSTGKRRALIGFVIEKITATNGTVINLESQRYHKSASESGKPVFYTEGLMFYAKLKCH